MLCSPGGEVGEHFREGAPSFSRYLKVTRAVYGRSPPDPYVIVFQILLFSS